MQIAEWLVVTMKKLGEAGVDSPRRDALVLLEDTIKKDRAWVLAHPEYPLQGLTLQEVDKLVERRVKREPLAYIRGKAWFYGRFFEVDPTVLIPRPESEDIIDLIKELKPKTVFDIGTGSGALAITAKLELPSSKVIATDADPDCLQIAMQNASLHSVDITFLEGSLLQPISGKIDDNTVFVANLPYVPDSLVTSPEIRTEPKTALFSGTDGLNHYREFWQQIETLNSKPAYIITESLESQHSDCKALASKANYTLSKTLGLIQLFQKR